MQECTREERRMMKYMAIYWTEVMACDPMAARMTCPEIIYRLKEMMRIYDEYANWVIDWWNIDEQITIKIKRGIDNVTLVTITCRDVDNSSRN